MEGGWCIISSPAIATYTVPVLPTPMTSGHPYPLDDSASPNPSCAKIDAEDRQIH